MNKQKIKILKQLAKLERKIFDAMPWDKNLNDMNYRAGVLRKKTWDLKNKKKGK